MQAGYQLCIDLTKRDSKSVYCKLIVKVYVYSHMILTLDRHFSAKTINYTPMFHGIGAIVHVSHLAQNSSLRRLHNNFAHCRFKTNSLQTAENNLIHKVCIKNVYKVKGSYYR